MGDSSGEHTETLQFLGLLKPFVKTSALGYVTPEDRQPIFSRISVNLQPDIEGRIMLFEMHRDPVFHRAAQLGVKGC